MKRMGVAFQIQDDVLNLVADYQKYGKEIGGDIWEGKRTLALIRLLNSCGKSEKAKIVEFLSTPRIERDEESINWIYKLMEKYDCIDYARMVARQLADEALKQFSVAYDKAIDCEDKEFIRLIVEYMIERRLRQKMRAWNPRDGFTASCAEPAL